MKKSLLLASLTLTLFSGALHQLQAQTSSTPNVILETTVGRYCQEMQLIGTLDNQKKLFWSHDNAFNYLSFPAGNENKNMVSLTRLCSAYAALCDDHTVFAWGDKESGGEIPVELVGEKVLAFTATENSLAVTLEKDHSVAAWGNPDAGGKIPESLRGKRVASLAHTADAIAALLEDGTVISWGSKASGTFDPVTLKDGTIVPLPHYDYSVTIPPIDHVVAIFGNTFAFTAVISDGEKEKLFSWNLNGDSFNVPDLGTHHLKSLKNSPMALIGILDDDTLVAWGRTEDHISAPTLLLGEKVLSLWLSSEFNAAYLNSGRLVSWENYYPPDQGSYSTTLPVAGKKILKLTDNAILFDDHTGFSWGTRSSMKDLDPLYPHGDVVDVDSTVIFGIPITLSSEGTVSMGLRDITPIIPQNQKIISISSTTKIISISSTTGPIIDPYFDQTATVSLTPIDSLAQFVIDDDMYPFDPNRLGEWQYQPYGSNDWIPFQVPLSSDVFESASPTLRANTKLRFVSEKDVDPYLVPELRMREL